MSRPAEENTKHPRGLFVLFSTEMWERFSFYSVDAMLVYYLTAKVQGFGWPDEDAIALRANYMMCVYASPLIGGWIADRFWGYRRTVIVGALFFMAGHSLFAVHSIGAVYGALACLVVGNGLFKANVSTMVGNLYSVGSKLKDRAYSIFYMGINIGAMLGPIVCEIVQPDYGYDRAFNAAALGMAISVAILVFFRRDVEDPQRKSGAGGAPAAPAAPRHPIEDVPPLHRVFALAAIFIVGIAFWMVFWQNGSTLALWAKNNTDWTLFTDRPVAGMIQAAINPAFIILFGIPVASLWKRLDRRGLEPSTPMKMCLGLVCAAAASAVLWAAALAGGDAGRVSCLWLIGAYALISLGELFLSAMGLSLVSKVAPQQYRGLMMGGWFLSLSLGGKFSGVIGVYWNQWSHATFFAALAALSLAAAGVLFVLLRFLRKSMPGV